MRTEQRWALWAALAVLAQICALRSQPYDFTGFAAGVWHFLALSAIGLLLWVAFDGNRIVSFFKEKLAPCAASSRQSQRATSSRS
jgi:hypothetical protein